MNAFTLAVDAVFLLGTGALCGVLLAVHRAVVPMLCVLSGERWVEVHRLLDPGFDPFMPRMNKFVLAAGILLVFIAGPVPARVCFAVADACVVGVALVSELRNVPINRRIDRWRLEMPADWSAVRRGWARANGWRTALAATGFAAAIGGSAVTWR